MAVTCPSRCNASTSIDTFARETLSAVTISRWGHRADPATRAPPAPGQRPGVRGIVSEPTRDHVVEVLDARTQGEQHLQGRACRQVGEPPRSAAERRSGGTSGGSGFFIRVLDIVNDLTKIWRANQRSEIGSGPGTSSDGARHGIASPPRHTSPQGPGRRPRPQPRLLRTRPRRRAGRGLGPQALGRVPLRHHPGGTGTGCTRRITPGSRSGRAPGRVRPGHPGGPGPIRARGLDRPPRRRLHRALSPSSSPSRLGSSCSPTPTGGGCASTRWRRTGRNYPPTRPRPGSPETDTRRSYHVRSRPSSWAPARPG